MRKKGLYLAFLLVMILFIFSSCSCEQVLKGNLSGLGWGEAWVRGQVVRETKLEGGGYYWSGLGEVLISTDVGNDYTFTVTTQQTQLEVPPRSQVPGESSRLLQVGEFELKVPFRIGETAKSKKITVYAERETFTGIASYANVLIVDGQATKPVLIKVTTVK